MEALIRATSRSIRSYNICHSCLQRLRHQRHLASPPPPSISIHPIKTYHCTPTLQQNTNTSKSENAHPLGAFYADLLNTPIPSSSSAATITTSSSSNSKSSNPSLPSFVTTTTGGDLTKEERAAKLFGNIHGSGYERRTSTTPDATWQTINGVAIPPRPAEPDNCCMSGCVHCVWDDYRDDIEEWAGRVKSAQMKSHEAAGGKVDMMTKRGEVEVASTSMDDDGGGSEALWTTPGRSTDADGVGQAEELFAGIPVGIREFMNVEKKIRERKRERAKKRKEAEGEVD